MANKTSTPKKEKKKPRGFNEKYPILYYVGDIPIRAVNIVSIYIDERNMAAIAKIACGCKMSVAKIIAYSGQPCPSCKSQPITITHQNINVEIPRGLLSTIKSNSGSTITKKKRVV